MNGAAFEAIVDSAVHLADDGPSGTSRLEANTTRR
jgi:hypothetical protein